MNRQRQHQPGRHLNTVTALAGVVMAGALVAGCSPDKQQPQPPANTPGTSPPTTPGPTRTPAETPAEAQQHALDAYIAGMDAFLKATETADPAYPDLARYVDGAAFRLFVSGLTSMRDQGLRGGGQTVYHPVVTSYEPPKAPTKVSIRDCMDTAKSRQYRADGGPYNDPPGGLRLVLADIAKVDGSWKLTAVGIHEVGSCKL